MARTITLDLFDDGSFARALADIDSYCDHLRDGANRIREEVAERIKTSAEQGFASSIADAIYVGGSEVVGGNVSVTVEDSGDTTSVVASGPDALFMEYGAGVHFNGEAGKSPHPNGEDAGMLIGEYGRHMGRHESWAIPGSTHTNPIITHGTPASMPMYNAAEAVNAEKVDIAREVLND